MEEWGGGLKNIYNGMQGSKLQKKITFPLEMLQKVLPFHPNFNLSKQKAYILISFISINRG